MQEPRAPVPKRSRSHRISIRTKRGKVTFPSVRQAAIATGVSRAKLAVFLRRASPRNVYYEGWTPPWSDDDEWEEMTDEERKLWNV